MSTEHITTRDNHIQQSRERLRGFCTANIPDTTFDNAVNIALFGDRFGAFALLEYFSYSYHHSRIRKVLTNLVDLGLERAK